MTRTKLSADTILDHAAALITAGEPLTFSTLARALGSRSQALYNYYPNQAALTDALCARNLHWLVPRLQKALFGLSGRAALTQLALTCRTSGLAHFRLTQFTLAHVHQDNAPATAGAMTDLRTLINQLIQSTPADAATQIVGERMLRNLIVGEIFNVGTGWFDDPAMSAEESFRQMVDQCLAPLFPEQ
ncbi:TetR/AcrR family transcriptional regulator [Schleiferilactobacillus shenzhenensis]|nr:TetR/AcrR family transcriptional regulator [Schleiferilactobacillus shenzhenensis]